MKAGEATVCIHGHTRIVGQRCAGCRRKWRRANHNRKLPLIEPAMELGLMTDIPATGRLEVGFWISLVRSVALLGPVEAQRVEFPEKPAFHFEPGVLTDAARAAGIRVGYRMIGRVLWVWLVRKGAKAA